MCSAARRGSQNSARTDDALPRINTRSETASEQGRSRPCPSPSAGLGEAAAGHPLGGNPGRTLRRGDERRAKAAGDGASRGREFWSEPRHANTDGFQPAGGGGTGGPREGPSDRQAGSQVHPPLHHPVALDQHCHLLDATQNSHGVGGRAQEAHQVRKRHDLHWGRRTRGHEPGERARPPRAPPACRAAGSQTSPTRGRQGGHGQRWQRALAASWILEKHPLRKAGRLRGRPTPTRAQGRLTTHPRPPG